MTTPRQMEPVLVARAVNSRLRVGRLTQAGQAITLTQTDATTCGPTCLLAAPRFALPAGWRGGHLLGEPACHGYALAGRQKQAGR